jgi:Autophagy protein 16 (ATG16)
VRDRESEVREGRKLVESVQDEMVSLNLQLNMAEQKAERLAAENKELVRRWMERMGEEADRMNEESKW